MKIHFVGIGGISMSALAAILHSRGDVVTGSDERESRVTEHLRDLGMDIYIGHEPRNFDGYDMLVYTQAVKPDNPELKSAKAAGVPVLERADLLGLLAREYEITVAVAGSHGKTTATSMLALCMLPLKPTVHIGGNCKSIGGNFLIGGEKYFITEACEYKKSFVHIKPKIAVVLNIDADHLDYYRDIDDVQAAFEQFCGNVPVKDGLIVVYNGDKRALETAKARGCKVITVGFDGDCDIYAENIETDSHGCQYFTVNAGSAPGLTVPESIRLKAAGRHNILNALSAAAVSAHCGIEPDNIKSALERFEGADRRWQYLGEVNGARLIADYAHHPKEIKAVLETARSTKPGKLIAVFQPHTFTRTQKLWDDFAAVLSESDAVILTPVYSAREAPVYGVTSENLAREIYKRNKSVWFIRDFLNLARRIKELASPGDLILLLGAGDIIEAGEVILNSGRR